ncbi:MAG: hypothetical protein J6R82_05805 [Clostridia bacterium]|nr:hypothetical protein [Clostridia bacterium]
MKRTTALVLLLAILLTSTSHLTGYASATDGQEQTPVTEGTVSETPTDNGDGDLPETTLPESILPPGTLPPATEPPTTLPPITEPPITEPPFTLPPVTEPEPSEEDLFYDALAAVIDESRPALEFSTAEKLSDDLIREVCTRALERTPRFFYLDGINVALTALTEPDEAGNLYLYTITPEYRFAPGEELDAAKAYVEGEVAKIIAEIPEDTTDLEKVLFLHDYFCTRFAYDGTHTVGDLYRLLQSGHGVCQAYVYLYAYILDALSIPNDFAISQEMNHIWNLVQVNGRWYHIDLTWDDPNEDQVGRALHTNFLRSDRGITETGHHDWIAPYICYSTVYEDSFLYHLSSAALFTPYGIYGVDGSRRMLMKLDLVNLTATPQADLSQLRWGVWGKPNSLWKEQYINLYWDGSLIYFNGPDAVWSFDPLMEELTLLFRFDTDNGYLYSLTGDGHTLTCTVSTAPGKAERTTQFTTPHIFAWEAGYFFSTHTCTVCDHSESYLSPQSGDLLTACLSTRVPSAGIHDLRLILLVDRMLLEELPPLTIHTILHSEEGDREVITTISPTDDGLFLVYERIYAGGQEYAVAEGYEMLGLILRGLEDGSYHSITVFATAEEEEIYRSTMSADLLFPTPEVPPLTSEPPATEEIPAIEETPLTDE